MTSHYKDLTQLTLVMFIVSKLTNLQVETTKEVIKKQKKKLFENGKGFDKYINNTFHLENSMIDCKPVKFMSFSIPMPPRKNSKNLLA